MAQKFVKATGLHYVFKSTGNSTLDITLINNDVSNKVNQNSIVFLTSDIEDDALYGYRAGSKYIWTHGELYPTPDTSVIESVMAEHLSDIYDDISTLNAKSITIDISGNVDGNVVSRIFSEGHTLTVHKQNVMDLHAEHGPFSAGSATYVPQITTDGYGHITNITNVAITDAKVKQSSSTTDLFMPILGAYSSSPTSNTTGQAYYNLNIAINTSTNTIKVNSCRMTYDTTEECMKFTFV